MPLKGMHFQVTTFHGRLPQNLGFENPVVYFRSIQIFGFIKKGFYKLFQIKSLIVWQAYFEGSYFLIDTATVHIDVRLTSV